MDLRVVRNMEPRISALIRLIFLAMAGFLTVCLVTLHPVIAAPTRSSTISRGDTTYRLYPATFKEKPDLPSPYRAEDGLEVLTARTEQNDYVLVLGHKPAAGQSAGAAELGDFRQRTTGDGPAQIQLSF